MGLQEKRRTRKSSHSEDESSDALAIVAVDVHTGMRGRLPPLRAMRTPDRDQRLIAIRPSLFSDIYPPNSWNHPDFEVRS
jgi:hypothetical protein